MLLAVSWACLSGVPTKWYSGKDYLMKVSYGQLGLRISPCRHRAVFAAGCLVFQEASLGYRHPQQVRVVCSQMHHVLFTLCRMYCKVHQHPSLHPNCAKGQEFLLCGQRRLWTRVVKPSPLFDCRRNRKCHHVPWKDCHFCTHCFSVLPFHHFCFLCEAELPLTFPTSACNFALTKVVAIIGFIIGMLFMSVYTIAMDTLLQCFIVDETNAKAKGKGKPQWAPEDLADLMDVEEKENNKPEEAKWSIIHIITIFVVKEFQLGNDSYLLNFNYSYSK